MNPTILAIDDSPEIHALLAVRLKPESVILLAAHDAASGLRMALDLQPDLILLDVDLGAESGFELCRTLKGESSTSQLPIIFLTGTADVEAKVRGFDLGAVDYVTKPFEPAELRARVRAALRTQRLHNLLALRAQIDGLTGLWNRAHFDLRLAETVAEARRHGRPLSLAMIDIDHFKRINDTHGHPFGDVVIQQVGSLLSDDRRQGDVACRYGGEEFALILPHADAEGAVMAAERIRLRLMGLGLMCQGRPVAVTMSIGVASLAHLTHDGSPSPVRLVDLADQALYAAKRGGRNRTGVPEAPVQVEPFGPRDDCSPTT